MNATDSEIACLKYKVRTSDGRVGYSDMKAAPNGLVTVRFDTEIFLLMWEWWDKSKLKKLGRTRWVKQDSEHKESPADTGLQQLSTICKVGESNADS